MNFRWHLPSLLLLASLSFVAQDLAAQDATAPQSAPAAADQAAPVVPALDLKPGPEGKLPPEQMQQLFRTVADKDLENQKLERNYTYIEREVQKNLDGKGQVKSTEIKTYEILEIYGEQVQRLIEKDDKPLDAKEAAKEEEKVQKIIDKRKNESEEDRTKRTKKEEKDREDGRKFVREVADAYDFKLVGTELVDGRSAWAIDAEPRPGFEPHTKEAKFLSKIHGRVWIDQGDLQLAKMDVETLDTLSFGLVLARIHKGTRFLLQQTRVNEEVWLPKLLDYKFDARVALLKGYNIDGEQTFRDYRKFRTSSKIVEVGEVKDRK